MKNTRRKEMNAYQKAVVRMNDAVARVNREQMNIEKNVATNRVEFLKKLYTEMMEKNLKFPLDK
jgi:hypothetical protein